MADYYTNTNEENTILSIKNSNFSGVSLDKYHILRFAFSRALNLEFWDLNSPKWEEKKLPKTQGEKGAEYHLKQITGKGSDDDFDAITRAILQLKHQNELQQNSLFENEKLYLDILAKYISRGIFELKNSIKGNDCIYNWAIENLELDSSFGGNLVKMDEDYQDVSKKIINFYNDRSIAIKLLKNYSSFRTDIFRFELLDSRKIKEFEKEGQILDTYLGKESVYIESQKHKNLAMTYDIQISKPKDEWKTLDKNYFQKALSNIPKSFKLGIVAGYDMNDSPYCFDLVQTPHLLVAGTTGSGKSIFVINLITSIYLHNPTAEFILIDPKKTEFKQFEKLDRVNFIDNAEQAKNALNDLCDEMEKRNELLSLKGLKNIENSGFIYKIVVIDELSGIIKSIEKQLEILCAKARSSGIHLVLATQTPTAEIFSTSIRHNVPSRIAFRTSNSDHSQVIIDESGAQKLLGDGDMLAKINGSTTQRIQGCYLTSSDISKLLDI